MRGMARPTTTAATPQQDDRQDGADLDRPGGPWRCIARERPAIWRGTDESCLHLHRQTQPTWRHPHRNSDLLLAKVGRSRSVAGARGTYAPWRASSVRTAPTCPPGGDAAVLAG